MFFQVFQHEAGMGINSSLPILYLDPIVQRTVLGNDSNLVIMINSQIPPDNLIVHFF